MGKKIRRFSRNYQLYLCMLLPLIWVLVFCYGPMFGLIMAFEKYKPKLGIFGSEFVGFDNFVRFFKNPNSLRIILNTMKLSLYGMIAGFPIPIILAIAINCCRAKKFTKTVQMLTYAPYFISTVVFVAMMLQLLAPRFSIYAEICGMLGIEPHNIMGDSSLFSHVYVWSGVWQGAGYSAIVYIAALAGVDPTLHEAALIDGASRLHRIWYVDLPCIMPTIIIVLILSVGNLMNVGFEKIFLMQNDMNIAASEVIATHVYKLGMLSSLPDYGYTTAVGMFNAVVNLVLILTVNYVAGKFSEISLF